jgi:hypothetical protein
MIKLRRHCVLQHAETGETMQRDVAMSSSDCATPPRSSSVRALNNDFLRIAFALAKHCGLVWQDINLNPTLRLEIDCQEDVVVSDRASRPSEFLSIVSTGLSELRHPAAVAFSVSIQTLGPMLHLLPALPGFRAFLSRAWGVDTVYPETTNRSSWIPQIPDGQCGVSSAWLADTFHKQYSMSSTFCEGSLIFGDQQAENVLDHCWLELNGSDGEELILDLTCDQAQGFDRSIVLDAKTYLDHQRVHYVPRERLSLSDLPNSPVWPRYQTLLRKLGSSSP